MLCERLSESERTRLREEFVQYSIVRNFLITDEDIDPAVLRQEFDALMDNKIYEVPEGFVIYEEHENIYVKVWVVRRQPEDLLHSFRQQHARSKMYFIIDRRDQQVQQFFSSYIVRVPDQNYDIAVLPV